MKSVLFRIDVAVCLTAEQVEGAGRDSYSHIDNLVSHFYLIFNKIKSRQMCLAIIK